MINGYLILPKKYNNLQDFLKEKDKIDILNINENNLSEYEDSYEIFNQEEKCVLFNILETDEIIRNNKNLLEVFEKVFPSVKTLVDGTIKSYNNDIKDLNSVNMLFKKYEITTDMLYKDSYYDILKVIQENIFADIDNIVKNNEKNLNIIDEEILKIKSYKNERLYHIYNDEIFNIPYIKENYLKYIDFNTSLDTEENRLNWVKHNYYVNELINLEILSKSIKKENYSSLQKELDLLNIEIESFNKEHISEKHLHKFNESIVENKDLTYYLNKKIKLDNDEEISQKDYRKNLYINNLIYRRDKILEMMEILINMKIYNTKLKIQLKN